MSRLRCITVATDPAKLHPKLTASAERYGYELAVLGCGQEYKSNSAKIRIVLEWMQTRKSSERNDIVLFLDAYDCVFTRPHTTLLDTYESILPNEYELVMICGAETNCWPKPDWAERFAQSGTPYRYPNSGTWIAPMQAAITAFKHMTEHRGWEFMDDQLLMQSYMLQAKQPIRIMPDYKAELFQTLYQATEHVVAGNFPEKGVRSKADLPILENVITHTFPYLMHGNGNTNMDTIISALNL